jgi:hypothetical protein
MANGAMKEVDSGIEQPMRTRRHADWSIESVTVLNAAVNYFDIRIADGSQGLELNENWCPQKPRYQFVRREFSGLQKEQAANLRPLKSEKANTQF